MTKKEVETFDDPAAFRRAVAGKSSRARQQSSKASQLPRAPAGAGDQHGALARLALLRVTIRYSAGVGFFGWNPATGWRSTAHAEYAAAIALAEKEAKACS